jgi:hypothetical protein
VERGKGGRAGMQTLILLGSSSMAGLESMLYLAEHKFSKVLYIVTFVGNILQH